jgi:hypothetical protein
MQQGLAFYQHRKLLRVLVIFNSSEVPELLVLYAPHIHIQAYNGNKYEIVHQSSQIEVKTTENYPTRRDDRVDIKNAKNGAKTMKLWLKQILGLFCKEF